jgi:hypothetical protein
VRVRHEICSSENISFKYYVVFMSTALTQLAPNPFKRLEGGKSPHKLVHDFLYSFGVDPERDCCTISAGSHKRWVLTLTQNDDLIVDFTYGSAHYDSVLTLSLYLFTIQLKGCLDAVVSTLEKAKSLVGCRLYLEDNKVFLAASLCGDFLSQESLDHHLELLKVQKELL